MDDIEKAKFADALAEAGKLLELTQARLQRARSLSEGDQSYERVDLISKRVFELKVKADWLQYSVLGRIHAAGGNDRVGSDRRVAVDRRIVGMQKLLLSVV